MSFHRLLEAGIVGGRLRERGSLIDYRGAPVPYLEPLDVAEHNAWLAAMRARRAGPDALRPARERVAA
jgi:hypothetical protein